MEFGQQGENGATPRADIDKKYDRQVRIWGAHGQARLEAAQICMLGAGPIATETLKNLVLGGTASFTVVDDAVVQERDLGNNFFFERADLGKGRAETATRLLCELNEHVKGSFSDESVLDLLPDPRRYFERFSLVIATDITLSVAKQVAAKCLQAGATFMHVRAVGPFATLQISGAEMAIVESKPDNVVADLRLAQPWPELQAFADSIDLESCTDMVHKHVPYALLLIKAIKTWQQQHGGPPANAQERKAFKALLDSWQRKVNGIPTIEENFQEAISKAHTAWASTTVPASIQALLDSPAAEVGQGTSTFWVMVAALKRFVADEGQGALPLEGSIPDMTATTDLYLQLQRLYRSKADEHCSAVLWHARTLVSAVGREPGSVSGDEVRLFCRNVRNLRVVHFRDIAAQASECIQEDGECNEGGIYVALLACSIFQDAQQRLPGCTGDLRGSDWELDIAALQHIATSAWQELGLSGKCLATQEVLTEVCRCAGASLHCVGSILGGIAAQEAIKLLLRQFVPVSGVLVYNGIHASTRVLDV